jgi:UDP-N-acetylmuramoyl-tripeptide--D-alanyl-D-alanine ligase
MQRLDAVDADVVVINDTVSAAPQSVSAALKALAQIAGERRSIAVLGELSVGDEDSQSAHDRIGRLIVRLNVKKLIVVGHGARHIHNAAGLEGSWDGESVLLDTPGEAYDFLREELRRQDIVLVKSSEAAGLGDLAERLAEVTR